MAKAEPMQLKEGLATSSYHVLDLEEAAITLARENEQDPPL
jgi:hypothetical protein